MVPADFRFNPLVGLFLLLFVPPQSIADHEPTIEQVLEAWKARQDRVKSFRFRSTEDLVWFKGSLGRPRGEISSGAVPSEDVVCRVEYECFDQPRDPEVEVSVRVSSRDTGHRSTSSTTKVLRPRGRRKDPGAGLAKT